MRKAILISVLLASLGVAVSVQYASTAGLDNQVMLAAKGGCGECDAIVFCTYCKIVGGSYIYCTDSSGMYIECDEGGDSDSDDCGICTTWNEDCGDYKTCTSPMGCAGCSGSSTCWGCDTVSGADFC